MVFLGGIFQGDPDVGGRNSCRSVGGVEVGAEGRGWRNLVGAVNEAGGGPDGVQGGIPRGVVMEGRHFYASLLIGEADSDRRGLNEAE